MFGLQRIIKNLTVFFVLAAAGASAASIIELRAPTASFPGCGILQCSTDQYCQEHSGFCPYCEGVCVDILTRK